MNPEPRFVMAATVTLAEVLAARRGTRLSEEEGWALLCASVQVPTGQVVRYTQYANHRYSNGKQKILAL